jgi:hypothetical protein
VKLLPSSNDTGKYINKLKLNLRGKKRNLGKRTFHPALSSQMYVLPISTLLSGVNMAEAPGPVTAGLT